MNARLRNLLGLPEESPEEKEFVARVTEFSRQIALISIAVHAITDIRAMAVNLPPGLLDEPYRQYKKQVVDQLATLQATVEQWPDTPVSQAEHDRREEARAIRLGSVRSPFGGGSGGSH